MQDFVENLEVKWKEVDVLIETAKKVRNENEDLYNALCRSITILIVSHLEGFTKDLVKNFIRDLNINCTFQELKKPIQRTYCLQYVGEDTNQSVKITNLIEKFSEYNCDIGAEAFLFDKNKNPNSGIITIIFNNFGFNKVFQSIEKSEILNSIFADKSQNNKIKEDLKQELLVGLKTFPFEVQKLMEKYEIEKVKKPHNRKTLWEEFISETNKKRHDIAHGNNFANIDDIHSLEKRKEEVIIFQYILILILTGVDIKK